MILESLRTDASHDVGLGNAHFTPQETGEERSHWFTINAGVGIDADVIASMEAQRAAGRAASPTRYVWTAAQEYFGGLGRRGAAPLSLQRPGEDPIEGLAMVIIQNTAPWTFFGPFAINPCPRASFDLGLDVFAPHSLGPLPAARFGLRMLRGSRAGAVPGQLTLLHDEAAFTIRSETPDRPAARRGLHGPHRARLLPVHARTRCASSADGARKRPCGGRNSAHARPEMAGSGRMVAFERRNVTYATA